VRVVLCHDAAECGTAAVHAAAAAAAAVSAAVLASVVVATGTSTLHSIYSHRTSTSIHLEGSSSSILSSSGILNSSTTLSSSSLTQLSSTSSTSSRPCRRNSALHQRSTPAPHTPNTHGTPCQRTLAWPLPKYISADATALRTIDETVPTSPEAAAVTQPEGAADIPESDLYSILEKYMRNTSELKPGSPAFERRIEAAVASTSGTTFPQTARCDQHLVICSTLSTLNSRSLCTLNSVLSPLCPDSVLSHCALIVHCAPSSRLCALALSVLDSELSQSLHSRPFTLASAL
jgi:hypothetical protein